MTAFRYGTSSFSAKSWVGSFYPRGTKPGDFLSYYATQFDCVEADVTYYRVPDEKLVSGWDRKVPDGFKICAKFPRFTGVDKWVVEQGMDRKILQQA